MWESSRKGFKGYLQLERSMSDHSIAAYLRDVQKLEQYLAYTGRQVSPGEVSFTDLQACIHWIAEMGVTATTQARVISGIRAFYRYLLLEDMIKEDPTQLLETPKTKRKLPDVLSFEEIEAMLGIITLERPEGHRNRAILETMYGCGLRVSEVVQLKISEIYPEEGFVRITGKGDKERLVPIGKSALHHINIYNRQCRIHLPVKKGQEDILFLNRRGSALSRVMIFLVIKEVAERAGIKKTVSPHTFRHSFATHLIEGGADLRAVQDMLGHESITTTEIYTHLDRDFLRSTLQQYHPRF